MTRPGRFSSSTCAATTSARRAASNPWTQAWRSHYRARRRECFEADRLRGADRRQVDDVLDRAAVLQQLRRQARASQHRSDEHGLADVLQQVEGEMKRIHDQFKTEQEYRDALKAEGFGTVEELRKIRTERAKRDLFQQRAIDSLKAKGRMPSVAVSEAEISEAFAKAKDRLPQRPATVTFRQIVVSPKPTAASRKATLAKMDSLRAEIAKGTGLDFPHLVERILAGAGLKVRMRGQ